MSPRAQQQQQLQQQHQQQQQQQRRIRELEGERIVARTRQTQLEGELDSLRTELQRLQVAVERERSARQLEAEQAALDKADLERQKRFLSEGEMRLRQQLDETEAAQASTRAKLRSRIQALEEEKMTLDQELKQLRETSSTNVSMAEQAAKAMAGRDSVHQLDLAHLHAEIEAAERRLSAAQSQAQRVPDLQARAERAVRVGGEGGGGGGLTKLLDTSSHPLANTVHCPDGCTGDAGG